MTRRLMSFFLIAISIWTLMHVYVASRLWNLPAAPSAAWHALVAVCALLLWLSFPAPHIPSVSRVLGRALEPIEILGNVWVGVLFVLLVWLLAADLVTGFGFLLPAWSRAARLAGVGIAALLAVFAVVQAMRPPEVLRHEVRINGLRPEFDGLRIVQLTDIHAGPFLGAKWLEDRRAQVEALRPDLLVLTGDLVDQDDALTEEVVPVFRKLRARLGVWAVLGNHEFYAGLERSLHVFEASNIPLLRDASVEVAPGLVLAGVDDLSARRQLGLDGVPLDRALRGRPPGATIFLCHSPWEVDRAAELGVNLMLSGHTHAGQIWPFRYLVQLFYPYVSGRFDVNGMTLIVSRGTGFWGPPMRLFRRGEITLITLRGGDRR